MHRLYVYFITRKPKMRIFSSVILLVVITIIIFEILLLSLFSRDEDLLTPNDEFSGENFHHNPKFNRLTHWKATSSIDIDSSFVESNEPQKSTIHIAVVICGERTEEATTMLKTATLFSKRRQVMHILAEDDKHTGIKTIIDQWPCVHDGQVDYKIYSLAFPNGKSSDEWKKLFKPCASQRLFLPSVLNDVDSLLYLDTDTLILRPVDDIWQHFSHFNSTQLAAMTPEGEVPKLNWYSRFARHPYYGQLGVNSGVMLMNLTRMRQHDWEEKILSIHQKYKYDITWGDQDILNILFHFHPDWLYVYGCEWNYRPDHCMYGNNCNAAKDNGISVLHGNRGVFHNQKRLEFKVLYDVLKEFNHTDDFTVAFENVQKHLLTYSSTYCGEMSNAFLKHPINYIQKS